MGIHSGSVIDLRALELVGGQEDGEGGRRNRGRKSGGRIEDATFGGVDGHGITEHGAGEGDDNRD